MKDDIGSQPGGELLTRQGWRDRRVSIGDVSLHVVEAGSGPPVILLHGFPEFWYSWRRQVPALANAGFGVLAADLRGFNLSDKPTGVEQYRMSALVADVAELIRRLAGGEAHVVGHDWGGAVAWRLAALHPQLVRKLVVMNAAFPAAYARELRRNPGQWLRSWYAFFFQLPKLPEYLIGRNNCAALEQSWRTQPHNPEAFTLADIDEYRRAFAAPGALTGPLNYYRAALRYRKDVFGWPQEVRVPTLLIWGERDPFATPRLLDGLEQWVPQLRIERIPEVSHWVQNDAPERVNALLIEFLRQ
ncbi:MAG: alpha/beta hydrolase [Planctomycetaceae bacterium]